jgi:hypothetical protein
MSTWTHRCVHCWTYSYCPDFCCNKCKDRGRQPNPPPDPYDEDGFDAHARDIEDVMADNFAYRQAVAEAKDHARCSIQKDQLRHQAELEAKHNAWYFDMLKELAKKSSILDDPRLPQPGDADYWKLKIKSLRKDLIDGLRQS